MVAQSSLTCESRQKKAPNRCARLGARKRFMRGAPGGKPARSGWRLTARRGALPMMIDDTRYDKEIGAHKAISIVAFEKS